MKAETSPQRELEGTNKAVRSTAQAAGKGHVITEKTKHLLATSKTAIERSKELLKRFAR